MSITVSDLTKIYGTQKAVSNISFAVAKGEIVGFLGPNGAGKSTTMKIITGYIDPDAGVVTVCGIRAGTDSLESKKKIGYLPESNALYVDMYVREYLHFIAAVHKIEQAKNRVNKIIETVGLTAEADKKIGQLSKGYKQRVGLAAALIHDPEVLILDEPTSGLDPNQIVEIREVIKKLGKDKTVLFSSHILQEVQAICDRVIIINKGLIVADDQLTNLMGTNTGNTLTLQLKETVDLSFFAGIKDVQQLNATTWKFVTSNADALKRQLLELCLNKNLNIVSLQSESAGTLEDIFRNLTQDIPK
ncbi:MAG: gliding motility-associated ABC transporter ATP-binding subunit GldA [Ferruginibacter sp.]